MGWSDDPILGVTSSFPPIPEEGLARVLKSWTGRGALFEALSASSGHSDELRRWSASDVRMRANRVLLAILEPMIAHWPLRIQEWADYLPASRAHFRVTKETPFAGVAWAESRRRYGWPPTAFYGREPERGADMLAVQVLRWCGERLQEVWLDTMRASPSLESPAERQILALLALLNENPLNAATPLAPARADLRALSREGSPWGSVAAVAQELLKAERSVEYLAFKLLRPDEAIRWRLFHLAVLGVLLESLQDAGCLVTSTRPLSPSSTGPNYLITTPQGDEALLWFEASGVWNHLRIPPPFVEATSGLMRAERANGADILLLRPGSRALAVECKYSCDHNRIAREGYYQAMAYGAEAHSRLADWVLSVAVGPETVVSEPSFTMLSTGRVGTMGPTGLRGAVDDFLDAPRGAGPADALNLH